MSFGRRTRKRRDPGAVEAGGKFDPEQTFDASSEGSSLSFFALAGTLGSVVFVASLALFWWLDAGSDGEAVALTHNAKLFSDDATPVARSYTKRPASVFGFDAKSGQVMTITLQTTETGFDAIDSELHERCLRGVGEVKEAYAESLGKVYLTSQEAEQYLSCSMTVYTRRFCEPFYKTRVVKRLQRFDVLRKHTLKLSQTGLGRAYSHVAKNIEETHSDVDFGTDYNPAIVSVPLRKALRTLSERGIVTSDHFGWVGVPEALKPYMKEPKHDACNGTETSWLQAVFG